MADGKKSVFKRPEQPSTPVLGPGAEQFVHGTTQSLTADEAGAEPKLEPGANDQAEDTLTGQEPMKRLTIDIPLSLHKRVKSQCANRGTTIAEVVRKYLEKTFPDPERKKGS
jgi:hypothetical protein